MELVVSSLTPLQVTAKIVHDDIQFRLAFDSQVYVDGNGECDHAEDEHQKIESCFKKKFLGADLPRQGGSGFFFLCLFAVSQ